MTNQQPAFAHGERPETAGARELAMDLRLRLVAQIAQDSDGVEEATMQALNEISITKGSSGGMCSYEIYVNGVPLTVV